MTIEQLMASKMARINTLFGTSYTVETFIGTEFYKNYYAEAQRQQESEILTSEIFLKALDYFVVTNERISRPAVTTPGQLETLEEAGYIASIKAPIDADAGKLFICVDVDDEADGYLATRLDICTLIQGSTAGGIVTQGDQVETITLTNGQAFDYKFSLPDRQFPLLRLTITTSENNQVAIKTPEEVKDILLDNIAERYRLGKNFEPQRYFSILDAPWASQVLLEWSLDDGTTWEDGVFDANFDDKFETLLENTTVIEA